MVRTNYDQMNGEEGFLADECYEPDGEEHSGTVSDGAISDPYGDGEDSTDGKLGKKKKPSVVSEDYVSARGEDRISPIAGRFEHSLGSDSSDNDDESALMIMEDVKRGQLILSGSEVSQDTDDIRMSQERMLWKGELSFSVPGTDSFPSEIESLHVTNHDDTSQLGSLMGDSSSHTDAITVRSFKSPTPRNLLASVFMIISVTMSVYLVWDRYTWRQLAIRLEEELILLRVAEAKGTMSDRNADAFNQTYDSSLDTKMANAPNTKDSVDIGDIRTKAADQEESNLMTGDDHMAQIFESDALKSKNFSFTVENCWFRAYTSLSPGRCSKAVKDNTKKISLYIGEHFSRLFQGFFANPRGKSVSEKHSMNSVKQEETLTTDKAWAPFDSEQQLLNSDSSFTLENCWIRAEGTVNPGVCSHGLREKMNKASLYVKDLYGTLKNTARDVFDTDTATAAVGNSSSLTHLDMLIPCESSVKFAGLTLDAFVTLLTSSVTIGEVIVDAMTKASSAMEESLLHTLNVTEHAVRDATVAVNFESFMQESTEARRNHGPSGCKILRDVSDVLIDVFLQPVYTVHNTLDNFFTYFAESF